MTDLPGDKAELAQEKAGSAQEVPEQGFAVISLSSESPHAIPANQAVVRGALRASPGVTDQDPEPLPHDQARAQEITGNYENEVMTLAIRADRLFNRVPAAAG